MATKIPTLGARPFSGPGGSTPGFNQWGEFLGYTGMGGGSPPPRSSGAPAGAATNPLTALDASIPGFSGLSSQASNYLSQLMSGGRTSAQDAAVKQRQAQQSVVSGMPNTQNISGTLLGNSALRDERDFAGAQQGKGFQGLLEMLGSYAGKVFPTANAGLQAQVQREGYASEAAMNAARLAQANQEAEGRLGLGYAELEGRNQLEGSRLQQEADKFEKTFSLEEKKIATQLGISERELALELARLNADTAYKSRGQDLNEFNSLGGLSGLDALYRTPTPQIPKRYKIPQVIRQYN